MEDNLVRLLQGSIDEHGVSALARQLGHGEGEIGSALSIVIPTFVSGLAHKALSRGGATEVRSALNAADERILADVPAAIDEQRVPMMDEGSSILNMIFGDKLSGVQASLGSSTGLGKGGAASLMRMHAPIAMATVARHYRGRIHGDRELVRELAAEGALAEAFLPRSLAPLLAAEAPVASDRPRPAAGTYSEPYSVPQREGGLGVDTGRERGPGRFLIPAAIGAAILAAVLMFVGPRDRGDDPALLGRPGTDEGAGLLGGEAEEDMDRAGEKIREGAGSAADETKELGDETKELGAEAEETLREGGRALEEGTERAGERIEEGYDRATEEGRELYERAERGAEDLFDDARREGEGLTDDVERRGDEFAREAEEEGRRAADSLEERRNGRSELSFESTRFFEGQSLELSQDGGQAVDEIVDAHAERPNDRLTLRGPNPSQLDALSEALADRGVTGTSQEVDGDLDHIEVVFEP